MRHSHATDLHLVPHRLPSFLTDQIFESWRQCSPGMRADWAQRVNERQEERGRWMRGEEKRRVLALSLETADDAVSEEHATLSTKLGTTTVMSERAGEAGLAHARS